MTESWHLVPLGFYPVKVAIYTVSGKKVTPCVLFYNSVTGSRILTKFCANSAASNSKQTAKFQENLSTTATVIVVLVRAPKKWSVNYRQRHRQLTVIKLCRWRNRTIGLTKVCVRNVLRVLEAGLKTLMPLFDRFINDRLLELSPLFDQAWFQLIHVTNPVAVDTLLQFSPNTVVYQIQVRTVGRPHVY